jgi:hypothetical protein
MTYLPLSLYPCQNVRIAAMASCGSAAQRRLWPPVALQPSVGYGLLWLCSPAWAMASCGSAAQHGLSPPHSWGFLITHNDVPQSVRFLWTSDQLIAETSTWQHKYTQHTNIHAPSGIQTHNRSRRGAIDLRLRPSGYWDWPLIVHWHSILYCLQQTKQCANAVCLVIYTADPWRWFYK